MKLMWFLLIAFSSAVVTTAAPADCAAKRPEYRPLTYSQQRWQNSTYWTGVDWARVGKDWQHPGTDAPSVRRFMLPNDGTITISGAVHKVDLNGGDGIRAIIRLDNKDVWTADIEAKDGKGKDPQLTLEVKKGQALRFVVHQRGAIYNDSTGWDPIIRYADGKQYQASAAFGDQQGRDGWHYEMEVAAGSTAAVAGKLSALAGLDLQAMVEADWRIEDRLNTDPDEPPPDWFKFSGRHLDGARKLLAELRRNAPTGLLAEEQAKLEQLAQAAADPKRCNETLYLELRRLKRRIALANPLLNFDKLLFCKRRPTEYSHLVMQYFGWRAQMGGGLFVLEEPGRSLKTRDLLAGKLADGSVLCPNLSYDGRRIVFSYVTFKGRHPVPTQPEGDDEAYYHLYVVNADGSGLRQITSGPYDDLMPAWLPDGGIVFSSTRRKGYARCFGGQFGQRWHVYTLHRVEADGNNLRILSHHDTNEWFPSVMNDGRIVYARWDYIDRDAVTHQNLWATRPDGTNPLALWGNATPKPHCAFEARAVPDSRKLLFTASAHHSVTGGSLVLVDPAVDNNAPAAIQRLTPEIPFPEAEGGVREYYCAPWPLSERYFLVAYSPIDLIMEPRSNADNALGLYLLDAFGNRELIYRDPEISSTSPIPLRATPPPPILPPMSSASAPPVGTLMLSDVYRGLDNLARGTIKQLRIVQVFPKTTNLANAPRVGVAGEENARAILGTVPVWEDGSAYFELPAGKPVLFQALDKDGFAYQTMRTVTYVQPGEKLSCIGCHESRMSTPPPRPALAAAHPPARIEPGPLGGAPFSYNRFVQPILDRRCVSCHGGEKPAKGLNLTRNQSYTPLSAFVPRYPARNQIQVTEPGGKLGALGSVLLQKLRAAHEKIGLTDEEMRTLAAWIDLNAVFFGSFDPADNAKELRGEAIAMPAIQ